ncbi:RDD family protein [Propionivibrio soli]|uniref:RDD family protein n=1 Tax=Propionivibrio soli TaxID=2976531 RepID=UPI0021E8F319
MSFSALREQQPQRPGFWRRVGALGYESLLLCAVVGVAVVAPHVLIGILTRRIAAGPVLWLHLFLVLFVYFGWFWSSGRQTLAMKTWGLRLSDSRGVPIKPTRAALRYLYAWLSFLTCGAGFLWAIIDRDGQYLHDRLAHTRLLYVPRVPRTEQK